MIELAVGALVGFIVGVVIGAGIYKHAIDVALSVVDETENRKGK